MTHCMLEAYAKQSYYDILGVSKDADARAIKKAQESGVSQVTSAIQLANGWID